MPLCKFVTIHGRKYPVEKQGTGKIPCLCIGVGSLMQRTLSDELKKIFTVYSIDLYFIQNFKHPEPKSLTMKMLVNHVLEVVNLLNLIKPIIFAHSCFGILAIEIAKYHDKNIGGLILVASAPQWNDASITATNKYFEEHAEPERIINDRRRKQHYAKIRKPTDSEASVDKYISDSARYWGDFNISEDKIRLLWKDIEADDDVMNRFFGEILPQHDLATNIEKVQVPVLLLAGEYDFDSIPLIQWATFPQPQKFTIANCGKIGHWPNLENPVGFDNAVKNWVENNFEKVLL